MPLNANILRELIGDNRIPEVFDELSAHYTAGGNYARLNDLTLLRNTWSDYERQAGVGLNPDPAIRARVVDQLLRHITQPETPAPSGSPPAAVSGNGAKKFVAVYAPEDETHCDLLNKHLRTLKRTNQIELYRVYADCLPGDPLLERAREKAWEADYILALVTVDLFNSDDWYDLIQELMAQRKKVIPILVEQVYMQGTGLENLTSMPSMKRVISNFPDPDTAYLDIAEQIRKLIS